MARKRSDPREDRLRRRRKRSFCQKLAFVAIAAAVCIVGFLVVRKTFRPIALFNRERAELRKSEAALRDIREENKKLLEKKKYLTSPAGAQAEARKLGYVRKGEIPIVMNDEKSNKSKDDAKDK